MKKLITSALVFLSVCLSAFESEYSFHHFHAGESGLSFDDVKCIIQDTRSNIWVGTRYGLNRFDGISFTSYFKSDLHTGSDFIRCLYMDKNGILWIGTGSGLAVYDFTSDTFINPYPEITEQIMSIVPDSSGNLYIGTSPNGAILCIRTSGEIVRQDIFHGLVTTSVPRLAINGNDDTVIYAYCDNIYSFDRDSGAISPLPGILADYFKGDDIGSMIFSPKSNVLLYVLGKRYGLCEVNLKAATVKTLFSTGGVQKFTNMRLDSDRNLWLASTSGLIRYNLNSGRSEYIKSRKGDKFSLADNNITCSFEDNQGNLWVASAYEGLNCAARSHSKFHKFHITSSGTSLSGCNIKSAVQDSTGIVWIASENNGLLSFDPRTGIIDETGVKVGLPVITSVCIDGERLWLGSRAGIYSFDTGTGKVGKFYSTLNGGDYRVLAIAKLSSGTIIASATGGVMKYDRAKDKFTYIPEIDCSDADVLAEDRFGTIWMATYAAGINACDKDLSECRKYGESHGIPNATSYVMVDDMDNEVWALSFGSGFFRYDRENDTFIKYDRACVPSLPGDIFYASLRDTKGRLWLSSDKGLVCFDPALKSAKCLGTSYGLLDDIYSPVALKLMSGEFLFASKNGFVTFNPLNVMDSDYRLEAGVSRLVVSDRTVIPGPDSPIMENVDVADTIHLNPMENAFSLNVGMAKNMFVPGTVYASLSDFDQAPKEVPSTGTLSWFGIPAGTHSLRLFSYDSSGNEYDVHKKMTVVVDPPFWASGTGVLIIILLALFTILAAVLAVTYFSRRRQDMKLKEFCQRQEAEAVHEKMDFFSNVIHEIKTPLMLIRTPLKNLASMEEVPESAKAELQVIENSSASMDKLVKELLDFVRVEETGYLITRQNVDLIDRTAFICFNFSDTAKSRNLTLDFNHSAQSLPVAVDSKAFDKILNNLLGNAVKFAESSICVKVETEGDRAVIRVSNDGNHIPEDRRAEIFKPFVLFRDETAPYTPGFGIGLAYARTLTELLGGTLELSPETDRTEFILSLPNITVPENGETAETETSTAGDGRKSILIVEDNPELLGYLKTKMEADYNVIAVDSAEAALKVLGEQQISLVLTDIGLTRMSGIQLCSKITSNFATSHIPVVMISAISSESTKVKCMESGATMYIEKPFTIEYLTSCIGSILNRTPEVAGLATFNVTDKDAEFLKRLEKVVADNIGDDTFSVKQLENELMMSHTALYKKTMGLLNTSPVDYIRSRRLTIAAQLIRQNGVFISEVCYKVGFSSPSYFTKCFREAYGMAPSEYARKYSTDNNEQ